MYNFRSIPVTSVDSQTSQKKHLCPPPTPVAGDVTSIDDERETELQTLHICLRVSAKTAIASVLCSLKKPEKSALSGLLHF
jgi:hypothetical protein